MDTVFTSAPFMLFLVMASYLIGSKLYRKTGIALLHPLIVSIAIIIFVLKILGINYETFRQGSEFINFLSKPLHDSSPGEIG